MQYQQELAVRSIASNRYNLYTNIHKGLRAFMADTLVTVGQTDGTMLNKWKRPAPPYARC